MLPVGTKTRIAVYRSLPHIQPNVLDGLTTHVIGGLLGNDMVDPSDDDRERAEQLVNERGKRAAEKMAGLRERGVLRGPDG